MIVRVAGWAPQRYRMVELNSQRVASSQGVASSGLPAGLAFRARVLQANVKVRERRRQSAGEGKGEGLVLVVHSVRHPGVGVGVGSTFQMRLRARNQSSR